MRKCVCGEYNLTSVCRVCGEKTLDVGYKFKQIKDAPRDSSKYFLDKRKNDNN